MPIRWAVPITHVPRESFAQWDYSLAFTIAGLDRPHLGFALWNRPGIMGIGSKARDRTEPANEVSYGRSCHIRSARHGHPYRERTHPCTVSDVAGTFGCLPKNN